MFGWMIMLPRNGSRKNIVLVMDKNYVGIECFCVFAYRMIESEFNISMFFSYRDRRETIESDSLLSYLVGEKVKLVGGKRKSRLSCLVDRLFLLLSFVIRKKVVVFCDPVEKRDRFYLTLTKVARLRGGEYFVLSKSPGQQSDMVAKVREKIFSKERSVDRKKEIIQPKGVILYEENCEQSREQMARKGVASDVAKLVTKSPFRYIGFLQACKDLSRELVVYDNYYVLILGKVITQKHYMDKDMIEVCKELIDFVEQHTPGHKLIIKPHPRDVSSNCFAGLESSENVFLSSLSAHILASRAKRVFFVGSSTIQSTISFARSIDLSPYRDFSGLLDRDIVRAGIGQDHFLDLVGADIFYDSFLEKNSIIRNPVIHGCEVNNAIELFLAEGARNEIGGL